MSMASPLNEMRATTAACRSLAASAVVLLLAAAAVGDFVTAATTPSLLPSGRSVEEPSSSSSSRTQWSIDEQRMAGSSGDNDDDVLLLYATQMALRVWNPFPPHVSSGSEAASAPRRRSLLHSDAILHESSSLGRPRRHDREEGAATFQGQQQAASSGTTIDIISDADPWIRSTCWTLAIFQEVNFTCSANGYNLRPFFTANSSDSTIRPVEDACDNNECYNLMVLLRNRNGLSGCFTQTGRNKVDMMQGYCLTDKRTGRRCVDTIQRFLAPASCTSLSEAACAANYMCAWKGTSTTGSCQPLSATRLAQNSSDAYFELCRSDCIDTIFGKWPEVGGSLMYFKQLYCAKSNGVYCARMPNQVPLESTSFNAVQGSCRSSDYARCSKIPTLAAAQSVISAAVTAFYSCAARNVSAAYINVNCVPTYQATLVSMQSRLALVDELCQANSNGVLCGFYANDIVQNVFNKTSVIWNCLVAAYTTVRGRGTSSCSADCSLQLSGTLNSLGCCAYRVVGVSLTSPLTSADLPTVNFSAAIGGSAGNTAYNWDAAAIALTSSFPGPLYYMDECTDVKRNNASYVQRCPSLVKTLPQSLPTKQVHLNVTFSMLTAGSTSFLASMAALDIAAALGTGIRSIVNGSLSASPEGFTLYRFKLLGTWDNETATLGAFFDASVDAQNISFVATTAAVIGSCGGPLCGSGSILPGAGVSLGAAGLLAMLLAVLLFSL